MRAVWLVGLTILSARSFTIKGPSPARPIVTTSSLEESTASRKEFISNVLSVSVALVGVLQKANPAFADEGESESQEAPPVKKSFSIAECKIPKNGKPANCVSTASVRQVDYYAPPWTYEVDADEAMARLKGAIASDNTLELISEEDRRYLKVKAARNLYTDILEFAINDEDRVVTFRSSEDSESPPISDFGANKNRLEAIRKRAGIFGVMGEDLGALGGGGTGALGQLKAFYGLQSGKGFEDVFDDE